MEIGVQLYTLRNYLKKQEDFPRVFERVKAMGASTVQVSGTGAFDSKFLGKLARETGLTVCATHSPFDRIKDDLDRLAEEHKDFGCPQIGIGRLPAEYEHSHDIFHFTDEVNKAAERLKAYGMTIAYHNHWFEFDKLKSIGKENKTMFDLFLEEFSPSVEFIPDVYWLKVKSVDPSEFIKKLTGRISVLHLKDYKKRFFVPIMKPVGDGILDFKGILNAAKSAGVKAAVAELDISKDPFGDTEKSLKYIYGIL
jgi:sugar phosphate isomerase/epimerase